MLHFMYSPYQDLRTFSNYIKGKLARFTMIDAKLLTQFYLVLCDHSLHIVVSIVKLVKSQDTFKYSTRHKIERKGRENQQDERKRSNQ